MSAAKRLLLLRHAKSSWADESTPDFSRPLSPRGERDAPEMGRRIALRGIAIDLIVSSPANRAKRTALYVAAEVSNPQIAYATELYLASPRALLEAIAAHGGSATTLLVVAHNPGLSELANQLVPELGVADLPTAGLVAIDSDAAQWSELASARRRLAFYDFPKNVGAPTAR